METIFRSLLQLYLVGFDLLVTEQLLSGRRRIRLFRLFRLLRFGLSNCGGPRPGRLPFRGDGLGLIPAPAPGRLTAELAGDCARGVNETAAPFPASAALLEFTVFGVFRTPVFALF